MLEVFFLPIPYALRKLIETRKEVNEHAKKNHTRRVRLIRDGKLGGIKMTEIDIMYLITLAVTVAVILYQKRKIDRLEDKVIQSWKRFYRRDNND